MSFAAPDDRAVEQDLKGEGLVVVRARLLRHAVDERAVRLALHQLLQHGLIIAAALLHDLLALTVEQHAVDQAARGGKPAVDLPTGKNQAGSFYQPCIVICDPNTLETLPEEQYRCGCAEIIKYSMLGNAAFFEELYKTPVREQYEHVIEVCVQMKRDIVGADEYDLGRRRTLNLGHTFGHAVEQCSDFSLLHGEAVAIGMATVTRAAVKRGICGEETLARLLDVLHRYGLPTETGYPLDKLYEAELVDKKISDGKMHLIVPEKIGQVRMETIPVEALRDWMQDGGIR